MYLTAACVSKALVKWDVLLVDRSLKLVEPLCLAEKRYEIPHFL